MIVEELKIGETFPINEKLAGIVPMAIPSEQAALTSDIMENGLKEPVVLWKGAIVDGRCRQKACISANVPIRGRFLDEELSEDDVKIFVKSANTRRNLTTAQKIMVASKESGKPGSKTLADIANSWSISRAILTMANYISKTRPEFVEPLFNGLTVDIVDVKGNATKTNKISAIHAFIKREEEDVTEESSHGWSADSHINSQKSKDWFYEFVKTNGVKNVFVGCHHKTKDRTKPLGCIPTVELRAKRKEIHSLLNLIWQSKKVKRNFVYKWLGEKLGYKYHTANIRTLDEVSKVQQLLLQFIKEFDI